MMQKDTEVARECCWFSRHYSAYEYLRRDIIGHGTSVSRYLPRKQIPRASHCISGKPCSDSERKKGEKREERRERL